MLSRAGSSQPSRCILQWGKRCTSQWLPAVAVPSSLHLAQPPASSRRSYATKKKIIRRSPTVIRAERDAERSRTPALSDQSKDSADTLFTPQSAPSLEYFTHAVTQIPTGSLSAQEARDLAVLYCSIITKVKTSWKIILQDHNISLPTLHNAACLVLARPNSPEHWKLGTHMLHVASESGHIPSTLSIVSFRHQVLGGQRKDSSSSSSGDRAWLLRAAQQRFDAYFHSPSGEGQRDPDALTLAGFAALSDNEDRAARYFRRAVEQGNAPSADVDAPRREPDDGLPPRAPRWSWEAKTLNQLGEYHYAREQDAQAASYFRTAALELDDARACMGMVRVALRAPVTLDQKTKRPVWAWYLTKAAMSGLVEAALAMGVWELETAKHLRAGNLPASGGGRTREQAAAEHEKLGREWLAIVGEDKSRAKLLARYDPIFSSAIKLSIGDEGNAKS